MTARRLQNPGPPPENAILELARALARRLARADYDRRHTGESAIGQAKAAPDKKTG